MRMGTTTTRRTSSSSSSPIMTVRAPSLLGVLHLQLLLSLLVASSNYCHYFGSYYSYSSSDHPEHGGRQRQSQSQSQQPTLSVFVECFTSSPPIISSASSQRVTLKGSSSSSSSLLLFTHAHGGHRQHHDDSMKAKASSVRLYGAASKSSADINSSTFTTGTTKKGYKQKRSTKKYNNNNNYNNKRKQKGGSIPKHMMNAARQYNSQLTKCNSVSELLSSFMEQTSTSTSTASTTAASTGSISSNENTSSATHLAGANKLNSVNFSTCLHRLARFAARGSYSSTPSNSNTNNNQNNDARKQVLSDPRFALLVCSMAEMASGVDASTSVKVGNELVVQRWRREMCGSSGSSLEGGGMRKEYIEYEYDKQPNRRPEVYR